MAPQTLKTFDVIRAPNGYFRKRLALDMIAIVENPTARHVYLPDHSGRDSKLLIKTPINLKPLISLKKFAKPTSDLN